MEGCPHFVKHQSSPTCTQLHNHDGSEDISKYLTSIVGGMVRDKRLLDCDMARARDSCITAETTDLYRDLEVVYVYICQVFNTISLQEISRQNRLWSQPVFNAGKSHRLLMARRPRAAVLADKENQMRA